MKFHSLITAAFLAGTASVAFAQTPAPNDTTAQARPADKPGAAAPAATMGTMKPAPMGANPNVTPDASPNDTTAQNHAGEKTGDKKMKHHDHKHRKMSKDAAAQTQTPRVNSGPDSGAPFSPATATDNTTEPKPAAPR